MSDAEIAELARRFELAEHEFRAMYTRPLPGGEVSLRERRNRDCVFFDRERGCTVYADRPRQCRSWPFWGSVVATPKRWAEEARHCPGMNRGALLDPKTVTEISRDDGTSGGKTPGRRP